MKKSIKLIFAAIVALSLAASCKKEVIEVSFSSDPESLANVPCKDPAVQVLNLTTNTNWIVVTPSWVKADPIFGNGNSIVSFTVESTYINEKTDVASRSGEIVFSGGNKSFTVSITQLGYTAPYDPTASIGGIPDEEEFMKFVEAVNNGDGITRWQDDAKEVKLLSDINLSSYSEWTPIADPTTVANANTASGYTGVAFKNVFNGNGHTIKGFNPTVNVAEGGTWGLFGCLDGATIKNLTVETNLNISGQAQGDAGVLVGTAIGSTIQDVTIKGSITSTGTATDNVRFALGGIAGFVFSSTSYASSTIKDCTVDLTVNAVGGSNTKNGATGAMYGGIVGFATNPGDDARTTIENCVNNGTMTVSLGRCSGICATPNQGVNLVSCTNNADQVNTFVNGRVGQIVSVMAKLGSIKDCVNNGNLTTSDSGTTSGAIIALCNADDLVISGGANYGTIISASEKYKGLLGANLSKFTSISGFTVGGKLGTYSADGNHVMIDVNASNFEQYIGSVSEANRAKISDLKFDASSPTPPTVDGIASAEDLKEFASLVSAGGDYSKFVVDGVVVLGADIDLSGAEWTPIGSGSIAKDASSISGTPFSGVFDGKGHTVDNFKVTVDASSATGQTAGLFGILNEATVKNVTIGSKVVIKGESADITFLGGVAGYALNSTVDGCTNKASMSVTAATDAVREAVGGIVGQMYTQEGKESYLKNCNNLGTITSTNTVNTNNGASGISLGGIVGFADGTAYNNIQFCNNKVDISAQATRMGGIVASANAYTKVEDCVNEGNISDTDVKATNSRVGGISSAASTEVYFTRCVNKGNVVFSVSGDSSHGYAGGILGQTNNAVVIDACENYGTIQSDMFTASTVYMGAILANGNNKAATISNCKVGGKIGPLTEDADHKVITLTAENFATYICMAKAGSCKIEGNAFAQ